MERSCKFLSTLSLRRATVRPAAPGCRPANFYPRSPCGERRLFHRRTERHLQISIHALLAESDSRSTSRRDWW